MKVPFCNLELMHSELELQLKNAFDRVLKSNNFIRGRECQLFEEEFAQFCETKYCVGVANGLEALYLILKALDIKDGDEVILPANTYIATALAVSLCGATPVLVDPDMITCNIDPSLIEEKITCKTKVIIAVHLQGFPANMDAINEIAKNHGLKVIEDAAQAHGAKFNNKMVGSLSVAAAFSFYPSKNIGALGDGGAIVTNDDALANKIRIISNYGAEIKYCHTVKGINSRLDELQAAFLRIKLQHLEEYNRCRREIAQRYLAGMHNESIVLPLKANNMYTKLCRSRRNITITMSQTDLSTRRKSFFCPTSSRRQSYPQRRRNNL